MGGWGGWRERGTGRLEKDQLWLKTYHLWCRVTILQAFKQELSGFLPDLVGRLAYRGQARIHDCGPLEIIKAYQCNVLGAAQSHPIDVLQRTAHHQATRHGEPTGPY